MNSTLSYPIWAATASSVTENDPPKPQHSSGLSKSTNSIPGRSGEFVPQMMGATAGGSHYVIERAKVFDKEFFGCSRLLITSAIGHRLTAASLVKGVDDIHFEFLQKL